MLGKEVIGFCILSAGQLSEETQETRNKDCERFRGHIARKTCYMSVAVLRSCDFKFTKTPSKKAGVLAEVLALLANPTSSITKCEETPIPTSDHGSDSD
jgi:hypothetical protein